MGTQKKHSENAEKEPVSVSITLWLFLIMAVMWLGFSLIVAIGLQPSYATLGAFRWLMAGLTFTAGLILIALWMLLKRHYRIAWYGGVLLLAAMTLAGLFDDIGLIDVLYMVGTLVPLVLLIKDRRWYLN